MQEKKQTKRYSDSELLLMKATFAENDGLLKVIRKVMLQMPLNALDLSMIEMSFKGKTELLRIIRKSFLPELDPDAPLGQEIDLWMTVNLEGKCPQDAMNLLIARESLINYIEQQLKVLAGEVAETKIRFADFIVLKDKNDEEVYSDFVCRNTMIIHTEQQLRELEALAGLKTETIEETQKRLQQNSSK